MKLSKHFVVLLVALVLWACEEKADLSHSEQYSYKGVEFVLPGNWTVTEDSESDGFRYIGIETPGDAVTGISILEKDVTISLEEYVDLIINNFNDELPVGSRNRGEVFELSQNANSNAAQGIRNQFSIKVASIEVPHTADFFEMNSAMKLVFIFTQVADEDRDMVAEGFVKVVDSFSLE
ncbi:hypothetical protein [Kiloniella antarctica]|uniref:PsbP C-terminal domain-containing protein n=1 Tax=Kiloniella antarctica TaxID=1550907 RepID=A0ABW5BHQ3_9PROT